MDRSPVESNKISPKDWNKLRNLNFGMGAVHAAAAIALTTISILNPDTFKGTLYYVYTERNQEEPENPIFALKEGPQIPLQWFVVGFFGVTSIAHFIYAGNPGDFYRKQIEKGGNFARWIEYGISATLMIFPISILCGIRDPEMLSLICVSNAAIMLCGWLIERNIIAKFPGIELATPFVIAWGLFATIWTILLISFSARVTEAKQQGFNIPSWIWLTILPTFLFFASFGVVSVVQAMQKRGKSYYPYEFTYILLSLFSKLFLGIWVAIGIYQAQTEFSSVFSS